MKQLFSATGIVLALALFLGFNLLTTALFKSTRLDLTHDKLYTLSEGSKNILGKLEEPIHLRFYFSRKVAKDLTPLVTFAQRVQELIGEYQAHSGGKIKLEVFDPEPFSEEEERALGYGLQGVPANAAGESVYFGLVGTNTTDETEIIPFIQSQREQFLEYDLTKLIYNLAHTKKKVVGLLSKLNMDGDPMARLRNPDAEVQSWYILEQMRERFDVRTIPDSSEKIDADIDVLMIVHPQGLTPTTLYAIDQYVLGGGKTLVFVDPHCEAQEVRHDPQNPMAEMMANRSSDLGPLLGAWGLEMGAEDLAADADSALGVRYGKPPVAVDYLVWLGLRGEKGDMDKDDAVTSQLETINIDCAGVLKKKDGATTTITPLLQSSKNSMRMPRTQVQFGSDPKKLLESFVAGGERLMLAARVNGPAKSAYPEGKPKPPGDGAAPAVIDPNALKESKGPINLIVVADADLLQDKWWTRTQNFFGQRMSVPTANNNDFVLNALDNMSGSNDLISLRSRGKFNRPFDRVTEIRREAEKRLAAKQKDLEAKLKDIEAKFLELQKGKEGSQAMILTDEQRKQKEQWNEERVSTRKELRKVKHDLDKDIESLGGRVKLLNTILIPAVVVLGALLGMLLRPKPKGG